MHTADFHHDANRRAPLYRASIAVIALAAAVAAQPAHAQVNGADKPALFQKYVGSPATEALLREPTVRAELQKTVGAQLPKLMKNIDVRADVDLIGGRLVVSGNAVHGGGEEEGIVCVDPHSSAVEAAIASKGRITLFTKAEKYEYVSLCVKDWITQFNNGHRDRFEQPKNVQVTRAK